MKNVFTVIAMLMLLATPDAFAQTWEGKNDDDGNRHGTWTQTDDGSGITLEIHNYRHGVLHGPASYFHPSGRKNYDTIYKDGVHQGAFTSYHDNENNSQRLKGTHTDGRESGEWTEWHSNGNKRSTINYFNGRPHGAASFYFASGGKETTTEYRNGVLHGPYVGYFDNGDNSQRYEGQHTDNVRSGSWTEWHSNGQMASISNYHAGKLHGSAEFFHRSGQPHYKTNYNLEQHHGPYSEHYDNADNSKRYEGAHRGNQRIGKWTEWHENSNLASEIIYQNGMKNGPASYYSEFESDLLRLTTVYQDDEHHGPYVEYYGDGTTKREYGEHRNGKKDGEWVSTKGYFTGANYTIDSATVSNWRDGEKHGLEISYFDYSEGVISSSTTYKNGRKGGAYEAFYSDADHTRRIRGVYVNDHRDGTWTHWFRNGQIEFQRTYESSENGEFRIGTWRNYNEDGELIKVSKYENGEIVSEQDNCNHDEINCPVD